MLTGRGIFSHLLILLLQLGGLLLVWLLLLRWCFVPHLTQFLGHISNRQTRGFFFYLRSEFGAENEECRPLVEQRIKKKRLTLNTSQMSMHLHDQARCLRGSLGSIGVFKPLFLLAFGWNVVLHLPLVTCLVKFGHIFKLPFFLGWHSLRKRRKKNHCWEEREMALTQYQMKGVTDLPSLRALFGKLREVDRCLRVFLLMLLTAGLDKVCIWGHFASWFCWILPHLCLNILNWKKEKKN